MTDFLDKNELGVRPVHERFISYETSLTTTGIQSLVGLGELDGQPVIKKLSGGELSNETLVALASSVSEYRQTLIHAGLRLPANLSIRVDRGLELIDVFVKGRDIDVMIRMKDPEAQRTWTEMIIQLCEANDGTNRSRAMIDAKPANFIKSNGDLYYIDLFPPMLRGDDGLITPWIPEVFKRDQRLMTFNFGDTRGQITKLLAGSRIAYADMYEYLETWTLQAIKGRLPDSTLRYILEQIRDNFPDMKLFYSGQDINQRMKELGI